MEHEKDEELVKFDTEDQDIVVEVKETKNEYGVVVNRTFKLPVSGQTVTIRRAKARDITAANDYAAKKGGSQSAAGLFLSHKLCTFNGNHMAIEEIEDMDLQDFTILQQLASVFFKPCTVRILPS